MIDGIPGRTIAAGEPLLLEVETLGFVPLAQGCGYVGDTRWTHGQWKGRGWSESVGYDLTAPEHVSMFPYGVLDHIARARLGSDEGWGMFEHASMGRHDPSGFRDYLHMAE